MSFADSSLGLYHYLVCGNDDIILNSLEKVNLQGYIYRKLKEQGYKRIVFIDKKGTYYVPIAYDKLSQFSYEFPDDYAKFNGSDLDFIREKDLEETNKQGPNTKHAIKRPENREEKDSRLVVKETMSTTIIDGNSWQYELKNKIFPAIKSERIKTAIVIPYYLFLLLEDAVSSRGLILLDSMSDDRCADNIILITFKELNVLTEMRTLSHEHVLRKVLPGFSKLTQENCEDGSYQNEFIEEVGSILTIANRPGFDEMKNMLIRNVIKGILPDINISAINDLASALLSQARGDEDKKIFKSIPDTITEDEIKVLEYKISKSEEFKKELYKAEKLISGEKAVDKLRGMVGMSAVADKMESFVKKFNQKKSKKISVSKGALELERFNVSGKNLDHDMKLHLLLLGNPGTGKTMIARMYGKLLKENNILPIGHTVEVSKETLKGRYVGHSINNLREKVKDAMGGVLFVDEAYQFGDDNRETGDSFEKEIMEGFYKATEDNRGKLAIVFAGYEKKTLKLIDQYEGLRSRFNEPIILDDYQPEDLHEIMLEKLRNDELALDSEVEDLLLDFIKNWYYERRPAEKEWANVRTFNDEFYQELVGELDGNNIITKDSIPASLKQFFQPYKSVDEEYVDDQFSRIIGLDTVKNNMKRIIRVARANRNNIGAGGGIGHFLFYGNPGTGKTEVAKIMAKILSKSGILKHGRRLDVTADELIQGVQGESSRRIEDFVDDAIGGVLMIDEIGQLAQLPKDAHKRLIQKMEEHKDEMCVILTGYKEEFDRLTRVEPGYSRRIKHKIEFKNYSPQELYSIMELNLHEGPLKITVGDNGKYLLIKLIENIIALEQTSHNASIAVDLAKNIQDEASIIWQENQTELVIDEHFICSMVKQCYENGDSLISSNINEEKFLELDQKHFKDLYQKNQKKNYDDDAQSFYAEQERSLLYIKAIKKGRAGYSTGFLISPDGYALTCNHVIEEAEEIEARNRIEGRIGGRDSWHKCTVEKAIPGLDIALIKLEGDNFPYMKLAAEDRTVSRGEKVVVMGYPFGPKTEDDYTSFSGTIASSSSQKDDFGIRYYLNAEGKRGNSGGPVVSQKNGEVIGLFLGSVIEERDSLTEEINFMRPIVYFWREFTE